MRRARRESALISSAECARPDRVPRAHSVLAPGDTHDYVSGCPLATPHGSMEGHYTFRDGEGRLFEVAIPFFPLAAPAEAN